jgi:hypothetical protein
MERHFGTWGKHPIFARNPANTIYGFYDYLGFQSGRTFEQYHNRSSKTAGDGLALVS